MNLYMKKIFVIVVSVLFSMQVMASVKTDVGGVKQPSVEWVHYLSVVEKAEIAARLAKEEYFRRKDAGTLHDKHQQREILFPASFIPIDSTSDTNKSAAAVPSGGNISCSINAQNPHAGSGPGGSTVVKAKSSGSCNYIHVVGTPPPTIGWDLTQVLLRVIGLGFPPMIDLQTAVHTRNSLNAVWSASSTQVFHPSCINGSYSHFDLVYVTPPGWVYTGPQPITIPNSATALVSNC
ncbi:MAG: hypothetical protein ACPH96_06050 [Porticoccaceae bacterium]|jgi:hypothetical protein